MKVAFDVDGTLIYPDSDTPRYEVIALFKSLESFGCDMYIWSGGGINYAQRWSEKLGLKATIKPKGSFVPDLAVDDMPVMLGEINLEV